MFYAEPCKCICTWENLITSQLPFEIKEINSHVFSRLYFFDSLNSPFVCLQSTMCILTADQHLQDLSYKTVIGRKDL